jgi:diguanylate cyclase (GGDEF)-like protein
MPAALKSSARMTMVLCMAQISVRRMVALIVAAVLVIGGTVFLAATLARDNAVTSAQQQRASELMLTAMLNEETGARGYFETFDPVFLEPYTAGTGAFARALSASRGYVGGDAALQHTLSDEARRGAQWHARTQARIDQLQRDDKSPTAGEALADRALMDGFRAANASYDRQLTTQRNADLSDQTWFAVGLAAALALALVYVGGLLVRRAARRERKRMKRQGELRELLQVSESETESRLLLVRHIERSLPGAAAAVFTRNNSDDRLEPVIGERFEDTALRGVVLEHLKPGSCLAVRLSRPYERHSKEAKLLECGVCGRIEGDLACEPLLVSGQVIGSVLVARHKAIGERDRFRVRDSVAQAAPILANQRNLALAELRAASDALTGLPNRRAADETIKRMAAHAARRSSPLAVVLLDLDHFKQINDVHGHEQGDKALAAVGQILSSTLRASDFSARYGGEEFLILLPDTDRATARQVAEKLRLAIAAIELSHVGSLTASFGVAALPDDAHECEQLLRTADRALYAAKAAGRNRVETATPSGTASVIDRA